jgi:hypothetical protein
MDMERATSIRNELGPLLDRLITQLDAEGSATQRAYFARIRRGLEQAHHDTELVTSIRELYCTPAVGFSFSTDASPLKRRKSWRGTWKESGRRGTEARSRRCGPGIAT